MGNIIEVKDPNGVKIYCSQSTWEQHIISPTGHPGLADNIDAIVQTIASPDCIYESHDSDPPLDDRSVYCKIVQSATYYNNAKYTKVVASICGGTGEVITAYPSRNETGGTKGEARYRAKDCD